MWKRFQNKLRCVTCGNRLAFNCLVEREATLTREQLARGEQLGLPSSELASAVEQALITCEECKTWYPVYHGLPVMLPYWTNLHDSFMNENGEHVRRLGSNYKALHEQPAPGEDFVRKSFSKEWLDYDYDGVIWSYTVEDRRRFFIAEMGSEPPDRPCKEFLEIGCGLGLVTNFASEHFKCDGVGVDLSLASLRATQHFRDNPFLHFVQASVFRLPFESQSFDLVYSHGVLHHTYSTKEAFRHTDARCRPQGRFYVWLYGPGTKSARIDRRIAYAVEMAIRPLLARSPGWAQTAALAPVSVGYAAINKVQRMLGRPLEPYNYHRALHAARDRLTPLFAHRHTPNEVKSWFEEFDFGSIRQVGPSEVPAAAADNMLCGVGMRGELSAKRSVTCAAS